MGLESGKREEEQAHDPSELKRQPKKLEREKLHSLELCGCPYTDLTRLSSGHTPFECTAARGPPTSAAANSGRQCKAIASFQITGQS